jgi:hypothetical protein
MIKQYKIIKVKSMTGNPDKFVEAVNQEVNNGWQPQGGLTVTGTGQVFMQAMVR